MSITDTNIALVASWIVYDALMLSETEKKYLKTFIDHVELIITVSISAFTVHCRGLGGLKGEGSV